jgi:putative hydrolase of HD superfamily
LAELFSLREQQLQGNDLASSRISELCRSLRTDSAHELAAAAQAVSPQRYWGDFANNKDLRHLADYIYEIGQLRLTPRTGWHFLKIRHESVAEHCYRAAQMAFLVSFLNESSDPDSAHVEPSDLAAHLLVHDIPEIRTGDPNSVAKHYVDSKEPLALLHQTSAIGPVGSLVSKMWHAVEAQETAVGRVAKDFDRLEMLVTARTLIAAKIRGAQSWIENTRPLIKTNIGKQVLAYIDERKD